MIFTEKRIRRARNLFITMLIICMTPLCENVRPLSGADSKNDWFTGKELVCAIDLGDDMRGAHGLETGFSYELIEQSAKDKKHKSKEAYCLVVRISCGGNSPACHYIEKKTDFGITLHVNAVENYSDYAAARN